MIRGQMYPYSKGWKIYSHNWHIGSYTDVALMTNEGAIIFVPVNELVDTHTEYMYRVYFDPGFYIDV